jgi:tetratricopeptide (TPR) repeat protein
LARKRRAVETVNLPISEKKEPARYVDPFQQSVGKSIEGAGKKLEGQGRNILYGLAALLVLGIIIWIFYAWSGRSTAAAQAELGKAIETSQAQVTDQPPPAGSTQKTFKTERERAEAAVAQFQKVAEKHGGSVGEKAKYFAAVNKLTLDKAAAISELDALSKSNGEVGKLSKFALANAKATDGQLDEAAAIYKELAAMDDTVIAKDTINFELASVYEKQGKKQEAADILFNLVKSASEAKDLEGKAIPLSSTANNAKDKLKSLDPERAKQIPEPELDSPAGGSPFGM